MNKSGVAAALAKKANISQAKATEYLNAVLEVISNALAAGDKVTLTGFGTFEVRDRAARMVTDIRTKEKRQTPATRYPAFSAGAVLKDTVHPTAGKEVKRITKTKAPTAPVPTATTHKTPVKAAKPAATSTRRKSVKAKGK